MVGFLPHSLSLLGMGVCPLPEVAPSVCNGTWHTAGAHKCLLSGMRHRGIKAVARVTKLVRSRLTAEPALGHLAVPPALSSAGRVLCTRVCMGMRHAWTREAQQSFGRHTAELGQAPDSRSCPLSHTPSELHGPGEAGTNTSLRLLPRKAVCSQVRDRAGGPGQPVAHLQPCTPPGLSKCHMATSRAAWASIPQARATVPLPLRGCLADPLRRTPTRGLCLCLCPIVSLCIFLPLVRWGHFSQGLF